MRSTLKCFEYGICGGALLISGLKEHKHVGNIQITQQTAMFNSWLQLELFQGIEFKQILII